MNSERSVHEENNKQTLRTVDQARGSSSTGICSMSNVSCSGGSEWVISEAAGLGVDIERRGREETKELWGGHVAVSTL
jgi:hypothetical protein